MVVEAATIEGVHTDGVEDVDPILAAIKESEADAASFDGEQNPSGGEVPQRGLYTVPSVESQVTNHGEATSAPETNSPVSAPEATIRPISTGLSEEPSIDSQYMAGSIKNEGGKTLTESSSSTIEVPESSAALNMEPAEVPEVPVAFAESAIPATTQAETQKVLDVELPADIAKTQDKFDKVIEQQPVSMPVAEMVPEVLDPQEVVDQIADPQERLEARTASVTEVLAKMRGDIQDISEDLDKRLAESRAKFEERIAAAESREKAASEQLKLAETERIDANNEKIAAQNDFEKFEGEISGRKDALAGKMKEVESLQALRA